MQKGETERMMINKKTKMYFGGVTALSILVLSFHMLALKYLLLISHSPMNHGSLPTQEKAAGEFPAAFSALYSLGNNFFTQNINSTPA